MNLAEIKIKATNLFQNGLGRNAPLLLIPKLFNVVMQAEYFTIVARLMGREDYNSFIALETEHISIENVTTEPAYFSTYWNNTLALLISDGALVTIILLLLSPLIFPQNINWLAILLILLADLIYLGFLDISYKAFVVASIIKRTIRLKILNTCNKLLAALYLAAFFTYPGIAVRGYLYLANSIVSAKIAILVVNNIVAPPHPAFSRLKSNIGQDLYFSISASANNMNDDLDKSMLCKLSNITFAGIHGSAYRFIKVENVLLLALFGASYKRFFQHGTSGIKGSLNFAKRLLPILIFCAIASLLGYWLLAPFIPIILKEEYQEAIGALLYLSPLLAIAVFRYLAADTLTGSNHQKARSTVQLAAAIINTLLDIWLIPLYSWRRVAWVGDANFKLS